MFQAGLVLRRRSSIFSSKNVIPSVICRCSLSCRIKAQAQSSQKNIPNLQRRQYSTQRALQRMQTEWKAKAYLRLNQRCHPKQSCKIHSLFTPRLIFLDFAFVQNVLRGPYDSFSSTFHCYLAFCLSPMSFRLCNLWHCDNGLLQIQEKSETITTLPDALKS